MDPSIDQRSLNRTEALGTVVWDPSSSAQVKDNLLGAQLIPLKTLAQW